MLPFILMKRVSLTQIKRVEYSLTRIGSSFSCLQSHSKLLCTDVSNITSSTNPKPSFTASDLITSCGFSHDFLTRLESSKRPDSVLKFLEKEGFSGTQIQTIVSKNPKILLCLVEKTLKPKVDFFRSVGFSEAETMIALSSRIIHRSVESHLIPSLDSLKTTMGGRQIAVDVIKRNPMILLHDIPKNLAPNVEVLRNIGTPESQVMKLFTQTQCCMVLANAPNRFRKDVEFLTEMGFNPSSSFFIGAMTAKGHLTELGWEGRFKFFRSFGFSNEEIICMFKKQPITLRSSRKKIKAAVEFYINRFHWSPTQLSKKPNVLLYSLGKRIIPRCSVMQILVSRSMLARNVMVSRLLSMSEKDFLEKYIGSYKDEVPELLDAYHGKLKFDKYNFDSGSN